MTVAASAFELGKHVLVEKPMDITLSKAKALCVVAKESGKTLRTLDVGQLQELLRSEKFII